MKKTENKKNKHTFLIIVVLLIIVIIEYLLLFSNPSFWFKKSVHSDSKSYMNKHCLIFYPNSKTCYKYAKEISKQVDDGIYDYSLIPYGDYYYVSYGNNRGIFVDTNYDALKINEISDNGKKIVSDYLRYTIKKDFPDKYYNAEYLESLYYENLDFSNVNYEIVNENLNCYFKDLDINVLVPLKYLQNELGMNFGYKDELYVKPTYIDANHPVICLTFDDGPSFFASKDESSSVKIVDTLYKYDATATFYVVGYELQERSEWSDFDAYSFLKKSINNGNEYGSHTSGHEDLVELDSTNEIVKAIKDPSDYLYELLGYHTLTYRPPGGMIDEKVLSCQPYPAILWNVDSYDWDNEDASKIYDQIMSYEYDDGDILLFHEIYDETASSIEKIVPELINKGCQLVTVSQMLKYADIDITTLKYYYNLNPFAYYE